MEKRDKNGLCEAEFLARYDSSKFKKPSCTADLALFWRGEGLQVLLVKRGGHPCIDMWALPGGFVEEGENLRHAALRELFEETQVSGIEPCFIGMFTDPGRDPRGWVITGLFAALAEEKPAARADDDARDARWFDLLAAEAGGVMTLSLTCDGITLSARVALHEIKTPFGSDYAPEILDGDGLAFDHAKLLAMAIHRMREA